MNVVVGTISSAFAVVLIAGCQPVSNTPEETVDAPVTAAPKQVVDTRAKLAELDQQIRSMVGMAYADTLAQCRLAEVGHRPCGGPEYYMAYSTTTVDTKVLAELIREHRELQISYQEEHGLVGTCEVIPRPQLSLYQGRCVAQQTSDR